MRSSIGVSHYAEGEAHATFGDVAAYNGDRPVLVWCHGNNQGAFSDKDGFNTELRALASLGFLVVTADLGGDTFGNDIGIARVVTLLDYLGADAAYFVGVSMGGCVALNFARVHPERVLAVAGIIPCLGLDVDPSNPAADEIDAAYPPAYDPGNPLHAAHDPGEFAADLPDDLPVAIWTSSNDPVCLPAVADAFVAARPQTRHTVFGAYGHGGITVAVPLVADWLRQVTA